MKFARSTTSGRKKKKRKCCTLLIPQIKNSLASSSQPFSGPTNLGLPL